ncbi:hypothetical protein A2W24_03110 [Microgenomates group bacterium RBG_16_45_19]|nr:MAG: hypothetical protein A2W24_03110 [Microgenomates group bacterium RBG_16_45_19]
MKREVKDYLGVGLLTGVMLVVRLGLAYQGYFNFSWDFGRDMLWVRQITELNRPMLVGAWGSLAGTFFGPGYFYLLAIPYWLSGGDPRAAVYMVTILVTVMIPIGYYLGKRWFGARVGWWWAGLFAVMPIMTNLALYSFPQQLIPLAGLGCLACLWEWKRQPRPIIWLGTGLLASLWWHFEPVDTPMAYLLLVVWLGYLWRKQHLQFSVQSRAWLLMGLVIPLLPNLIYDVRHEWSQLRALGQLATGADTSLGGGLAWYVRLIDRPINLVSMISRSVTAITEPWLGGVIIGGLIASAVGFRSVISQALKRQPGFKDFISLLALAGGVTWIYFLIFPRLVKDYYLYLIPVLVGLFLGVFFELGWRSRQFRVIIFCLVAVMVMAQAGDISQILREANGQEYRSQVKAVRWIYAQAAGQPLAVYTYTPLIYDYPYQYLFWWVGKKEFNQLPVTYAYKPDQPEYVINKTGYDQMVPNRGQAGEAVIFLIMEPGDHAAYSRDYWRSLFPKEETQSTSFPGGIEVKKLAQELDK